MLYINNLANIFSTVFCKTHFILKFYIDPTFTVFPILHVKNSCTNLIGLKGGFRYFPTERHNCKEISEATGCSVQLSTIFKTFLCVCVYERTDAPERMSAVMFADISRQDSFRCSSSSQTLEHKDTEKLGTAVSSGH